MARVARTSRNLIGKTEASAEMQRPTFRIQAPHIFRATVRQQLGPRRPCRWGLHCLKIKIASSERHKWAAMRILETLREIDRLCGVRVCGHDKSRVHEGVQISVACRFLF